MRKGRSTAVAASCVALLLSCSKPAPDPAYTAEIEAYRQAREQRLRREDGWLTLTGLFWLEPGPNTVGSRPGSAVLLPADVSPPEAGLLVLENRVVRIVPEPEAGIRLGDERVGERELKNDRSGEPDLLRLGRLTFQVIERSGRYAVRVKDPESPVRRGFRGLEYYPVDAAYRVEAELEPYDPPRPIEVQSVTGTPEEMLVPGLLRFRLAGRELTLEPLVGEPSETELFIIFRDETSGSETYGAGRYLYADLEEGRAILDFNRAYNPPCAFTPFATCPLPPRANRLPVAVRAGELRYAEN